MVFDRAAGVRFTERARLVPIGLEHVEDLWRLHQDDAVAQWHGGRWTCDQARGYAERSSKAWETEGVHRWIAYDRVTCELIGRGGLSHAEIDGQRRFELGWTVRAPLWGRGYATEIGQAGLALGFNELNATEVVAITERHNKRSRAVMERLGMRYSREILAEGLLKGQDGIHENAPFVLYTIGANPAAKVHGELLGGVFPA